MYYAGCQSASWFMQACCLYIVVWWMKQQDISQYFFFFDFLKYCDCWYSHQFMSRCNKKNRPLVCHRNFTKSGLRTRRRGEGISDQCFLLWHKKMTFLTHLFLVKYMQIKKSGSIIMPSCNSSKVCQFYLYSNFNGIK